MRCCSTFFPYSLPSSPTHNATDNGCSSPYCLHCLEIPRKRVIAGEMELGPLFYSYLLSAEIRTNISPI
ncbi:Uncharacterized protein HZ326_20268 [Fusarium oxysporum f. sp. albedinis]|nr:Uncharacterized protein HZ326_20268 [Fusarium oxysporum f. sp. albedinis]